ncbi:hypothetical protein J5N97_015227 [Dioscorea zingiberensis]|uniref:Uncharacterized protein n=1 Tax=Dioscorea zingiberensis TaxID=325984 RepID=A0A9D5CUY8_9LILI|nr:hypothetical protein J5N97_015227 [Dioscorea zingiberensis]
MHRYPHHLPRLPGVRLGEVREVTEVVSFYKPTSTTLPSHPIFRRLRVRPCIPNSLAKEFLKKPISFFNEETSDL